MCIYTYPPFILPRILYIHAFIYVCKYKICHIYAFICILCIFINVYIGLPISMSTKECPTYRTILCLFEPNLMTCPEAKSQWIAKIFWRMTVLQLILDNRIKGENIRRITWNPLVD